MHLFVLLMFCFAVGFSFRSGMNYLLAPFFVCGMQHRSDISACFSALIGRLLPSTFTDEVP